MAEPCGRMPRGSSTVPAEVYVRRKKPPSTGCGSSLSSLFKSSAVIHHRWYQRHPNKIADMKVRLYSSNWCRDCRSAKQFMDSHGIAYTEINIDADPAASAEVVRNVGKRAIPQLVIDGEWFQPYRPGRGLLYDELFQRLGIPRNG